MRPLMPPVQTPDNLFHDGNPLTGELGTIVDAEHLNNEQAAIRDTQSELIAILTAAAMEPASTAGQLLAALNKLYAPFNDTLGALSTLVGGANKLPYFTAADAAALTALSSIGRDIIGKATVADVLTYLGLKEAAKRDVGTGANQIPDMSSFLSSTGDTGFQRFPGGLILQWGFTNPSPNNTKNTVAFPIAYSTRCNGVILQYVNSGIVDNPAQGTPHQIGVYTRLGFDFYYTGSATGMQHFWFSWGY
ncbi:gp53-like domain-containing protein [Enterobacter roggenkampii]